MSELRLRVPAEPENVLVVRELLRGIDPLLARRPGLSEAVQTAVSEAANNVVMHAYRGGVGPLEVEVSLHGPLEIRVRDWGVGFDPRLDEPQDAGADWHGGEASGLGRAVIAAFADDVGVGSAPGAGSEVRLRWDTPALFESRREALGGVPLPGDTVLCLFADRVFAEPVARVLSALASRARLAVDRLSDLQLIADALVTHAAPALADSHLSLAILSGRGRLQITAGPFAPGASASVRRARVVGGHPLIDRLADDVELLRDPRTGQELLVLGVGRAG